MHKNTKVVHAPLPRSEDVDQHRSVIRLTAKGQARVADAQSSGETEGRPNWMLILMEKMGISRDHFGRLSFKKVVPRSCRTEAPQKAIPEDDTTNAPPQSFFGHPLVLMRRILGRKEGIESAHGPVLFLL